MPNAITVKMMRRIPKGTFAFDEIHMEAICGDTMDADTTRNWMKQALDAALPLSEADPGDHRPHGGSAPTPQQASAGAMDLNTAEQMQSPAGPSRGKPLYSCDDNDLEWIANSYKKGGLVKTAAAIVLAARKEGRTTQRG